jgi:2-C-methyl-D-erythritol 2,4-cyclodiphosphate synthase
VVLHAIADALLGAMGADDIGKYFPNTDKKYKDISSLAILKKVAHFLKDAGYRVGNIDAMLLLETPKIVTYKMKMRRSIAKALDIEAARVSVKATTHEGVGAIGRGEAAAAYAVVLINSKSEILNPKQIQSTKLKIKK